MNRRGFLGTLVGGVAAGAAVRSWPFRVFSFPQNIVIAQPAALNEYVQRTIGLRIPLLVKSGSVPFVVDGEGTIGRGTGSIWRCLTAYTPEELERIIAENKGTQAPLWETTVRKHSPWVKGNHSAISFSLGSESSNKDLGFDDVD
jgi:hypothetical protein